MLVPRGWIIMVQWGAAAVYVNLRRDTIKNAPRYDPGRPVDREDEKRLYAYDGRPGYWEG